MKYTAISTSILLLCSTAVNASWLSEITGVNIDVNQRTVEVKAPNPAAIPEMIKNLPKDLSQFLLNPAAPAVAQAIRETKARALERNPQPIPQSIKNKIGKYFPPHLIERVRWTTAASGVTIDGLLSNFGQEGGVTVDSVIIFRNVNVESDYLIWAHELTHVVQYENMGIDTFAFVYTTNWGGLESQANSNASLIMSAISQEQNGVSTSFDSSAFKQQLSWNQLHSTAKRTINAAEYIWIDPVHRMTGNNSNFPIFVSEIIVRNDFTGQTFNMPCNAPTCLYLPHASGQLLSPFGCTVVGVTAAFQLQ